MLKTTCCKAPKSYLQLFNNRPVNTITIPIRVDNTLGRVSNAIAHKVLWLQLMTTPHCTIRTIISASMYSDFSYVSREQLLCELLEQRVDRKVAIEVATNADSMKR